MKVFHSLAVFFVISLKFSNASRILFIAPTPSFSHQVVFQPIWKELSLRGHQVTAITPNPLDDPKLTNLTEISLNYIYGLIEQKYQFSLTLNRLKDEPLKFANFFVEVLSVVNEDELSDQKVQRLIQDKNAKFDLVIFEFLLPTMLAFSHRFNCPAIAITSVDASLIGHDTMGNPSHPALNPDSLLKFNIELTFTQRLISTLYSIARRISFIFVKQAQDDVIRRYFGPGYPPLDELLKNVDMFFMNANPAFHNIRPTAPAVINIGGSLNVRSPRPLPKDIKTLLDNAKQGAIYFSLGTNVRTKILEKHFVDSMLQAMSELPYQFIWKCDDVNFPGVPDNVHVVDWCSQQDILRHPNLKAFITQGGLQSLEEAISFKKPVVCIPYFADQFSNCIQAYNKGMGLTLDHHIVNSKLVKEVILNVAENQTYRESVTRLSEIAEDQPMTGLERAVWWTEYVLRHKGAKHLRYGGADMPLYKYYLVDVLAAIFGALFIILLISIKLTKLTIKTLLRCFKSKKVESSKQKVKKN